MGPDPGAVVIFQHGGFLYVNISVKLFRLYIKWSLVLEHICAGGGGNVTFGV